MYKKSPPLLALAVSIMLYRYYAADTVQLENNSVAKIRDLEKIKPSEKLDHVNTSTIKTEAKVPKIEKSSQAIIQIKSTKLSYEDNWCIPLEDLSEKDKKLAKIDSQAWYLKQGLALSYDNSIQRDNYPLNNSYIEAYQEMDSKELLTLADNNDVLAMTMILQKYNDFDSVKSKEIAKN